MENRWWEYYVVRYFAGSVLGAVIMLLLKTQPDFPLKDSFDTLGDFKDAKFLGVSLIAALGFAFCYIASAPILTLHATRAHLRRPVLKERWLLHTLAITASIGMTTYFALKVFSWPVAIVVGFVIGMQIALVLTVIIDGFRHVETYYRGVATARSESFAKKDEPASPGMEYVTSYRHLREHGNAFGILILELILAGAISELCDSHLIAWWLLAWLLPAPFAWVIGTVLEGRFVASPLPPPAAIPATAIPATAIPAVALPTAPPPRSSP